MKILLIYQNNCSKILIGPNLHIFSHFSRFLGWNNSTSTSPNTLINVFVTFRASESAKVGSTYPITLTATIGFPFSSNTTQTFTYTPTIVPASALTPVN